MANTTVGAQVQVEFASIGQMRKAIKEATSDLIAMQEQFGKTSPQAIAAAKRIAELKDRIEDAKEQADLFDPGKKFQAFTTAASQVAAGFSAVQGAMALVGAESEDVQKGLLKVQGALALSQGLSQLGDLEKSFTALNSIIASSTILQKANAVAANLTSGAMRALGISVNTTSTSFKVLRTAIISTGIGALVVAIGFAVEALMNLADSSDEAAEAEKRFEKQQRDAEEAIKLKNKALEDAIKFTSDYSQILVKEAKIQGKSEEEIVKIQRDALKKKIELRKQDLEDTIKNGEVNFEKTKAYGEALRDLENFELDQQLQRQEKARQNQEDARKKGEAKRTKAEEENRKKREEAQRVQYEAERSLLNDQQREELDALKEFEENKRILQAAGFTNFATIEIQYQEIIVGIRKKYRDKEAEEDKKDKEEKLKRDTELQNKDIANKQAQFERIRNAALEDLRNQEEVEKAKQQLYADTGNALGVLSNIIGQETVAGKALAVAQATINTWLGVTEVLKQKSVLPEPAATISKVVNVATIVASGLNAVRNIVRTQIPRSGGGGSSPSLSGGGAAPVTAQPTPTVTAQALNAQAINNLGNQGMRAYVLNSDITNNEQRNAYLQRNARIG